MRVLPECIIIFEISSLSQRRLISLCSIPYTPACCLKSLYPGSWLDPKIGEVVVCYCLYFFTRRKCPGTEHRLTFFGAFFAIRIYIGKYYKVQHAFIAKSFNIVLIKFTYIYLYSKKQIIALSTKKVSRCSVPGHLRQTLILKTKNWLLLRVW